MTSMNRRAALAVTVLSPLLAGRCPGASAADISVYSSIGVQAALEELAPKFEKATGNRLVVTWATAAMLSKRIQGGETPDAVILTPQTLAALAKDGRVSIAPDASFASSGIGVAIKAGSPRPDISTPDAFKRTLVAAKSIAYSDPAAGGTSGVYFAKLLNTLGLADVMKAKTRHPLPGGNSANLVVSGDAELAIQQKPELMSVSGVDVIGTLPGTLNSTTVYAVGAGVGSKNMTAVGQLSAFLHSPDAALVLTARGLDPQ